ncbi:hypothetical protein D3C85_1122030 [compost metagenome]
MIKFKAPTVAVAAGQLASNLPDGRAWQAKNLPGTNVYAAISACGAEFREIQLMIETLAREFDVRMTDQLLPDWERSCGLPEECIGQLASLEDRRNAVILRLRKIPFVTKEEFELLAFELTGLNVTVIPGAELELFPLEFPARFSVGNSYFKLYVIFNDTIGGFPYSFALPFLRGPDQIVRCVFEQIVSATVLLIFESARPPVPPFLYLDGSWTLNGFYDLDGNLIPGPPLLSFDGSAEFDGTYDYDADSLPA